MEYLPVAEARRRSGLRLVLTAHVPAPWGEAAKAIFRLRNVPFVAVEQIVLQPNDALREWTGHRNAPLAIYEDEPALSGWLEIVMLAERLGSGPSLLPADITDRALSLGFSAIICGYEGFGWTRRLLMTDPAATAAYAENPGFADILRGYGARPQAIADSPATLIEILRGLARQLHRQRERDLVYFAGDRLSAADVHWACLSQMISPLAPEHCPMPGWMRENYARLPPEVAAAIDPILIAHRDDVFQNHIGLPLEF